MTSTALSPTASPLDLLSADIQSYIVAPAALFGLGGFVFDIEGEATSDIETDITDHYAEDNNAYQDNIAVKPVIITLRGYVGELVYNTNAGNDSILQQVVQKLTVVSSFLPQINTATQQIQNGIISGDVVAGIQNTPLSSAADLFGLVKNLLGAITSDTPRQQQAYEYFKACAQQKILMGIQTPWAFLTDMAILRVTAIQPEGSKYITDFSVRYKQLRFAQTVSAAYNSAGPNTSSSSGNVLGYAGNYPPVVPVIPASLDGAAAIQAPDPVPIGNVQGLDLPSNQLPGWQSQLNSASDIVNNSGAMKILNNAMRPAP